MFFLPDTLPSALERGKHSKKLGMTVVKDLVIVMIAEKEVICVIFYLKRKCRSGNS